MISVAHYDTGMQIHTVHRFGGGIQALRGSGSLGLGDDSFGAHAVPDEIGATHFTFREIRIAPRASSCEYVWGQPFQIQQQSVIETGL